MESISQELKDIKECISQEQYKKAGAIIQKLGKGLTTEKAKLERLEEIRSYLKKSGQTWFLTALHVKYAVLNENIVAAGLLMNILATKPKYRKKKEQIYLALGLLLGKRELERFHRWMEEGRFDWKLINWLD
jgi:hypothetical protein